MKTPKQELDAPGSGQRIQCWRMPVWCHHGTSLRLVQFLLNNLEALQYARTCIAAPKSGQRLHKHVLLVDYNPIQKKRTVLLFNDCVFHGVPNTSSLLMQRLYLARVARVTIVAWVTLVKRVKRMTRVTWVTRVTRVTWVTRVTGWLGLLGRLGWLGWLGWLG